MKEQFYLGIMVKNIKSSIIDIKLTLESRRIFLLLGWQDVKQRYKRSKVGPFWLTISMGVMIGSIGLVFGNIFKTPMGDFLPFLTIGLILWTFFTTSITEGCSAFISSSNLIKQLPIPLPVHVFRVIWRNLIILLHNIIIIPIVYLATSKNIDAKSLLSIVGLLLVIINTTWVALLLSIYSTRYRDIPQLIQSGLQVLFYVTPVIWMPQLLAGRGSEIILTINPVYHMIEIVRAPLLGNLPTIENWAVSISIAIVGWTLSLFAYSSCRKQISYWI